MNNKDRYNAAVGLVKSVEDYTMSLAKKHGLPGIGITGKVHTNGKVSVTLSLPEKTKQIKK
jgi:hypothetical protein